MATNSHGEVHLTLGGKAYTFKMGTSALIELQESLSPNGHATTIEEIFKGVEEGRLKYVRAFIWAGLQKHHKPMTQEDVSDLLDSASQTEVQRLLRELGMTMVPADEDVAELKRGAKRPQKARRRTSGTGGNSTSTPVPQDSAEPSSTT